MKTKNSKWNQKCYVNYVQSNAKDVVVFFQRDKNVNDLLVLELSYED